MKSGSTPDQMLQASEDENFEKIIARVMSESQSTEKLCAVLVLDIDHLHEENGVLGQDSTNSLLQEVAKRLTNRVRNYDVFYPGQDDNPVTFLGENKFAILLAEMAHTDVASLVCKRIIHLLAEPFTIDGNKMIIGVSIGVACYPKAGQTPELLLQNANVALLCAKKMGKNQFQYFDNAMQPNEINHVSIEVALAKAIENNEFTLLYQPIVDLHSGELVAVEALCRWYAASGEIEPHEFIPVAENMGAILALGQWALKTALDDMQYLYHTCRAKVHCHVNLSPKQLMDDDFIDLVNALIKQRKIDPKNITFELTETALIENLDMMNVRLRMLSKLGFKISADDFGVGYSSLRRLISLPITSLKVDKEFVRVLDGKSENATVLTSILDLADNLNLVTIAEGIETEAQLNFLKTHHCAYGQGFYFARAMSKDELVQFILQRMQKNFELSL